MGEEDVVKNQNRAKYSNDESGERALSLEERRVLFGQNLRSVREQLNQSKKDVIQLTRISPPFIDALEEGNFDALPGEVFGRGFLKNICKALEIDSQELLAEYNSCWKNLPVKARSYGYSSKISSKRPESKGRSPLNLTNYFSSKGILLWVVGPICLIGLMLGFYISPEPFKRVLQAPKGKVSKPAKISPDLIKDPGTENNSASTAKASNAGQPMTQAANKAEELKNADEIRSEGTSKGLDTANTASAKPPKATPPNPVIEIAPKGISLAANGATVSHLMVLVKEATSIKFRCDQGNYESDEYGPGLYKFKFNEKIDIYSNDMSKLEITYNGRPLGEFGSNRDSKQLSFIAKASEDKNL